MKKRFNTLLLSSSLLFFGHAHAGVYSDDLSRCLVDSSTSADKSVLVQWMFTAMALHPDAVKMSSVTKEQRTAANKAMAEMMVRLMTETCLSETQKAIQYEGPMALQQGFNTFGQVAGMELFSHPTVAQSLAEISEYLDEEKLALIAPPAAQ